MSNCEDSVPNPQENPVNSLPLASPVKLVNYKNSGIKRGYGACQKCGANYANRHKPKQCLCGEFLGGWYTPGLQSPKKKMQHYLPNSVIVYVNNGGNLRSVKLTNADNRQFALCQTDETICFAQSCLDLRTTAKASKQEIRCIHVLKEPVEPMYTVEQFSKIEIEGLTPDTEKQKELFRLQSNSTLGMPSVVKVSSKSYAVISNTTTTSALNYVHVMITFNNDQEIGLKCMASECRKKIGRTKQVFLLN